MATISRRFVRSLPSFRGGALAPDLRCAIAHRGISRFRVRCFASPRNDGLTRTTFMASIHKDIAIDAHPGDVWAAVRDFGAVHQRLAPGFVIDARLEGDARIVTFHNGTVARETAGRLRRCAAAAGLCRDQRAGETLQRVGAGGRRWRGTDPDDLDRRRIAQRNRALYIAGQMDQAVLAMQKALGRATTSSAPM